MNIHYWLKNYEFNIFYIFLKRFIGDLLLVVYSILSNDTKRINIYNLFKVHAEVSILLWIGVHYFKFQTKVNGKKVKAWNNMIILVFI